MMLYAVAAGASQIELEYFYEKNLKTFHSFCSVLANDPKAVKLWKCGFNSAGTVH